MGVELVTFGCRLNLVESETIERQARAAGLSDVAVINAAAATWCDEVNSREHSETCAVPVERLIVEREVLRVLPSLRPPAMMMTSGVALAALASCNCWRNVLLPSPPMLYPLPPTARLSSLQPKCWATSVLHRAALLLALKPCV